MGVYHQKASMSPLTLAGNDMGNLFPAGATSLNMSRPSSSHSRASNSLNATVYILNNYGLGTPSPKTPESRRDPFSQLSALKPAMSSPTKSPTSGNGAGTASSKNPLLARRKLCFVTVGATAPFDGLLDACQTPRFFAALEAAGYTNLLLQHGHHDSETKWQQPARQVGSVRVSSFAFRSDNITAEMRAARGDPRALKELQKKKKKRAAAAAAAEQKADGKSEDDAANLDVDGLDLGEQWEEAEWEEGVVISHAGSGSILDSLRVSAPLIVVPNEKLLGNHQTELAEELAKQGYVVHGHLDDLAAGLEESEALRRNRKQWPPPVDRAVDPSGRGLIGVMDEEMGYIDLKGAASATVTARPDGLHLD